jgi:hypothetical protein
MQQIWYWRDGPDESKRTSEVLGGEKIILLNLNMYKLVNE